MRDKSLIAYSVILVILCTGFVVGARMMGEQGAYLAQGYMMTPAIAALITRLFFYEPRFKDANLRFGRSRDYLKYWSFALGITALSYGMYTCWAPSAGISQGRSFWIDWRSSSRPQVKT